MRICVAGLLVTLVGCHPSADRPRAPDTVGSAGSAGSAAGSAFAATPAGPTPPAPGARIAMFGGVDCKQAHAATSTPLFEKACAAHDGQGCMDLAMQTTCGAGVEKDVPKAAEQFGKACELGNVRACSVGSEIYSALDGSDAPQHAMHYADVGCKRGDADSCGDVALMYWQGIGVTADVPRAASMFDDQCKHDHMMSCANLAAMLYMGSVPRDPARMKVLARSSCDAHMQAGCNILAAALLADGGVDNSQQALQLFSKMCDEGAAPACDNAGQVYWHGVDGIAADPAKARPLFQKACDLGNGPGCTHLGEL